MVLFGALPAELKLSRSDKRALQHFAQSLCAQVAANRPFTCLLAGDRELRRWNLAFLGHDYATDVLSFPGNPRDDQLGEIAISIQRAQAQAAEHGHALLDEIRILMLHGLLHLTGLDHERDLGEMARAENQWRRAFNLPRTLIARAGVRA